MSLARSAGLISIATMLSRVLGLVREQLFAALLGATALADAFVVAFRIPNLLRDLFAEGALSQAFVPTFKDALKNRGKADAYAVANRVAGTVFAVIGVIVGIAAIFAPDIVEVFASDFAPDQFELTVTMTRIMLPFLAIVSLAAVAMGMLNAQDRYAWPALAPATFNLVTIAVGAGLYVGGVEGRWVALGWALGTVAGGLCQLLIQLPALRRLGYRVRPKIDLLLRDRELRRVALLMLPAVGGLAAVQINIVVNTSLATSEPGAAAWLNYAFRFLQLPIGVFGVAIATVSTTRYADAAADADRETMADHLRQGLRLVMFLTVPATVGLVVMGEPIIRLIYQRGAFEAADTEATAAALEWFAIGLVAYAAIKVAAPAFYAINRARFPMLASFAAVIGNVALALTLFDTVGYRILALGIAVAASANFLVLYIAFNAVIARVRHLELLLYLLRVSLAAAVMAAAVWGCYRGLASQIGEVSLWGRLVCTLVPIGIGAVVYAAVAWVLRVEELGHYARRLRRKR